jgi:hypothetical protein
MGGGTEDPENAMIGAAAGDACAVAPNKSVCVLAGAGKTGMAGFMTVSGGALKTSPPFV